MSWSHDIEAMPKGREVEAKLNTGKLTTVWGAPLLIIATKTGKVIASNWLPPSANDRRPVGRWRGLNVGEEPMAWMPWPTYP